MTCKTCGIRLKRGHINSRWHPVAKEARELARIGVTYIRIARKFGFSAEYVRQKITGWGK